MREQGAETAAENASSLSTPGDGFAASGSSEGASTPAAQTPALKSAVEAPATEGIPGALAGRASAPAAPAGAPAVSAGVTTAPTAGPAAPTAGPAASDDAPATTPSVDPTSLSARERAAVAAYQRSVATEAEAYRLIAGHVADDANRATLTRIADEKAADAAAWAPLTGADAAPRRGRARRYALLARLLGFTFAVKLMDRRKRADRREARALAARLPEVARAEADEERRGRELMGLLDERLLSYVGAMVLGMNDAVVEITGTLAGLTLAMQNTRLIALSGLITGIAATLSMAASEYLAARSDGRPDAKRACLYTGGAYALTVVLLLIPYLALPDNLYLLAMAIMLAVVVLILWAFNFYTSVAQDLPFKRRFAQMCAISLGVAALSFFLGLFCKIVLGVDV